MAAVEISKTMNNNLTRVYIGDLVLWFSYETIVAFHAPGDTLKVSENVWGPTTGKHLNAISQSATRLPRAEFEAALERVSMRLTAATTGL